MTAKAETATVCLPNDTAGAETGAFYKGLDEPYKDREGFCRHLNQPCVNLEANPGYLDES